MHYQQVAGTVTTTMLRPNALAIAFLLVRLTGAFTVPANNLGIATTLSEQVVATRGKSIQQTALSAYKKKSANPTKNKVEMEEEKDAGILSKPANLIFLPFVALFGLDLVANILVVVKRSIEVLLTGQYTCTGPWC